MNFLNILVFLSLYNISDCYETRCPKAVEWALRSKSKCSNPSLPYYYCLFDINKKEYAERCEDREDFHEAGGKLVILGGVTGYDCVDSRFQPFMFNTSRDSSCAFIKSACNELGQVGVNKSKSTDLDRPCQCDYRMGYKLIGPSNSCYCIPSEEDCTCYKQCGSVCPTNVNLPQAACRIIDEEQKYNYQKVVTLDLKPESTYSKKIDYREDFADVMSPALLVIVILIIVITVIVITVGDILYKPKIADQRCTYGNNGNIKLELNISLDIPLTKVQSQKIVGNTKTDIFQKENYAEKYSRGSIDKPSLTILKANSDDAGSYNCKISNGLGITETGSIVLDRPRVQTPKIDCSVKIGKKGILKCRIVSSLPNMKLVREKTREDESTFKDADKENTEDDTSNLSLNVPEVTSLDEGKYTCIVSNAVGTSESSPMTVRIVDDKNRSHGSIAKSLDGIASSNDDDANEDADLLFAQVVLTDTEAQIARKKAKSTLDEELRVVLIGKTGVGKSCTGNSIIGADYFPSGSRLAPVTEHCKRKNITVRGTSILLIDTPGIFAFDDKDKETEKEIKRCVHLAAPGPHAILFVIKYGRITNEDYNAINTFLDYFGEEMKQFVICVFTHVDNMENDETIEKLIEGVPSLKDFLKECGERYCKFNNKGSAKEKEDQKLSLICMIKELRAKNALLHYTDDALIRAERKVNQRAEDIEKKLRDECEQRYQQKVEEIRMKYEESGKEAKSLIWSQFQKAKEALINMYEQKVIKAREQIRLEFENAAPESFDEFPLRKKK